MNVHDFESALLTRFPRRDAEPWDHVGLSVGDPDSEVVGVMCSLDANLQALRHAEELGCNVMLTHHPVYISAPERFCPPSTGVSESSSVVYEAARRGISVISLHTNLDRSHEARSALPGMIGLEPRTSIEHPADPADHGLGSICECEPISLRQFAAKVQRAFGTTAVVWGNPEARITRPAFLGGSLGDFGEPAIQAGADVMVTGEVGYHRAQDLALRGMAVVILGHDRSEQPLCSVLAEATVALGLQVETVHINPLPTQWWVPMQGEIA